MTRDLTPNRADLWRLVERHGSIVHTAKAIGVAPDELQAWLTGKSEIPPQYWDRLLALMEQHK
jgi:hypothetical protein